MNDIIELEVAYDEGYLAGQTAAAEELLEILETAKTKKDDHPAEWNLGYFAAVDDLIEILKRKAGLDETNS